MRIIEYSKIAFQNLLNWFWNTKFPVPPPRSLNKYSTAKRKEGGKKNNLQTKAVVPAKYTFLECLNKLKALQLTFLLVKKTIEEEKASGGWSTREREEGNDPKIDRLQAVKSRPMAMGGAACPLCPPPGWWDTLAGTQQRWTPLLCWEGTIPSPELLLTYAWNPPSKQGEKAQQRTDVPHKATSPSPPPARNPI